VAGMRRSRPHQHEWRGQNRNRLLGLPKATNSRLRLTASDLSRGLARRDRPHFRLLMIDLAMQAEPFAKGR
jgi:hypothetical protein